MISFIQGKKCIDTIVIKTHTDRNIMVCLKLTIIKSTETIHLSKHSHQRTVINTFDQQ